MLPFAFILSLALAVEAIPTISFPLNSQVPPVARVSQPFEFRFSPGTFAQTSGTVNYSISGNPPWLSLDSPNRRLYGTPTTSDVGTSHFAITAQDSTGSIAMESTLVVSANPAPEVKGNVTTSLLSAGKLSGPDALVLYPSTNFSIDFDDGLFSSGTSDLTQYTAILSNRSPLPSWITFDSGSLAFSGTSPAAITLPQTLDILLIASDYPGFAGAEASFSIFVSNHEFVFALVEQTISLSAGDSVSITNLRGGLSLDGNPVADSDLQRATAQVPEWLSFDPTSLVINGTAPQGINITEVTVLAVDTYGDVANTTLQFMSASMLLRGDIGVLNAVVGEPVKFDMSTVIVGGSDLDIQVNLGAAAEWLQFDQNERTIVGEIPTSTKPQTIKASIKITKPEGSVSDSQDFSIVIESANATTSRTNHSPRTTSADSEAATASDHNSAAARSSADRESNSVIIAVSVCCVIFALIALILGVLFFRRRKKASSRGGRSRSSSPKITKPDISRPIYEEHAWENDEDAFINPGSDRDVEKGEHTYRAHTPEPPPQIALPSPLKKSRHHKYKPSQASTIGETDRVMIESAIRSGEWSVPDLRRSRHIKSRTGGESPIRGRRPVRSFPVHRDSNEARYPIGLPHRKRMTGIGHGRASWGSPSRRLSGQRLSAYSTRSPGSRSSYSTLSTGMLSPAPSTFPNPPPTSPTSDANRFSNADERKSVRLVPGSPTQDGFSFLAAAAAADDHRSLHEKRQSWIRQRASTQSPFFSSSCGSSEKRPSIIGTMNGDAKENVSPERSDSGGRSRPVTTGAAAAESSQFPGSLRRKRPSRRATARAYSESSSSGIRRWRSTALRPGEQGPLAGRAPSESPRSSMILSGLSESLYTDTEESVGSAASNHAQSSSAIPGLNVTDKAADLDSPKSDTGKTRKDANRESVASDIQPPPPVFNPVVASPFSTRSLEGRKRSSPSLSLSPLRSHPLKHHRSTSDVSPTRGAMPMPTPTGKENAPSANPLFRPRTPSPTRAGRRDSRPSSPLKSILSSPFKRISTTSPSKRPTSSSSPIKRPSSSRRSGGLMQHRPLSAASSTSALSHDELAMLGVNLRGSSPRKSKSQKRPKHSTLPAHTTAGAEVPSARTATASTGKLTATATPTALTLAALSASDPVRPKSQSQMHSPSHSPTPSLSDLHSAAAIRRSAHAAHARRSKARLSAAVREQLRAGMGGSIVNRGRHSSGSSAASSRLGHHQHKKSGSGGGGLGAMERRALAEIGNVGKATTASEKVSAAGDRDGGGVGAREGWSRGGGGASSLASKLESEEQAKGRSSWATAAGREQLQQQKARDERDGSVGAFL